MNDTIITLDSCTKELDAVTAELQTLPPGRLVKRGTFYNHVVNRKEVGITGHATLIRQLCRKSYLLARKKLLDRNISIMSLPTTKLNSATPKETISSLPNTYQGLPDSYFYHSSIEPWLAAPYPKNPFPLKGTEGIKSENGITFRSKSEYIIADILNSYNIPYRYEDAITLGGKRLFPDFKTKNPYNGKLIIWEHFGGLNLPGYGSKMNEKMVLYMKHGYIPFKNLICTFEPDIQNTQLLRNLVENIILEANYLSK